MSASLSVIEKEVSHLSDQEREALAQRLFDSVHNVELSEIDESWLTLAQERFENLKKGKDKGLTEGEFFERIRSQV